MKSSQSIPALCLRRRSSLVQQNRALVEQTITDFILPLPSLPNSSSSKGSEVDEVAWTDRLLLTMRYLDEVAVNTLTGFTNLKGA